MCSLKFVLIFSSINAILLCAAQEVSIVKQARDCLLRDLATICLKERALDFLNETIMSDKPISLYGIVDIVRDPKYVPEVMDEYLPTDQNERNQKLNDLLYNKVEEFFESRAAKINFGNLSEGQIKFNLKVKRPVLKFYLNTRKKRKKKRKPKKCRRKKGGGKKGGMLMMGGIAMAGMMAQMFMGKIAFMAGAALLVAKLALLLSTVIGFKKLSGGNSGGHGIILFLGGMVVAGVLGQIIIGTLTFATGIGYMMSKAGIMMLYTKMKKLKKKKRKKCNIESYY